jgi:SOS response regulatory protein OraA/RecX
MAAPSAGEEAKDLELTDAAAPPDTLLNAALRLLVSRPRAVQELRGRLRKKGFPAEEVDRCTTWLRDRGLLDDEAFSLGLVRDRLRFSPRSPNMLRKELTRRYGVAPPIAEAAVKKGMEEEGATEGRLAEEAARAWIRKQGPNGLRELLEDRFAPRRERARRRLYGFLIRRGFRGEAAKAGMEAGEVEARNLLIETY